MLTIESSWKIINFRQHFANTYRPLTKNTTAFVYWSTCLVHFTMLAPKPTFDVTEAKTKVLVS